MMAWRLLAIRRATAQAAFPSAYAGELSSAACRAQPDPWPVRPAARSLGWARQRLVVCARPQPCRQAAYGRWKAEEAGAARDLSVAWRRPGRRGGCEEPKKPKRAVLRRSCRHNRCDATAFCGHRVAEKLERLGGVCR